MAWVDGGVKAVRFDTAGQVVDATPLSITLANAGRVRLAAGENDFLVVWNENSTLKARRVRASDGSLPDSADLHVTASAKVLNDMSWHGALFNVAFAGQDYRVLWKDQGSMFEGLLTTRVSTLGTIGSDAEDRLALYEFYEIEGLVGIDTQGPARFLVAYTQPDQYGESTRIQFRLVSENSCTNDVSPPMVACLRSTQAQCSFWQPIYSLPELLQDNCDSTISRTRVDFGIPGTQGETVSVTDPGGNTASCDTIWTIVDDLPPTLYLFGLNGALDITLPYGTPYEEPGAWTFDHCDGPYDDGSALPGRVQVSGEVNPQVPGTYTLTYRVTDNSGNTTTATRGVTVLAP